MKVKQTEAQLRIKQIRKMREALDEAQEQLKYVREQCQSEEVYVARCMKVAFDAIEAAKGMLDTV
jgi:hypothetical protein